MTRVVRPAGVLAALALAAVPAVAPAADPAPAPQAMPGMPGPSAPGPASVPARRVVEIRGRWFTPAETVALVGETVTWTNDDAAMHTVTAVAGSFASDALETGHSFSFTPTVAGAYPYYCSFHRGMIGTLRVFALGLRAPAGPVRVGGSAALRGLVPAGTETVELERRRPHGGYDLLRRIVPAGDGSFTARVTVRGGEAFRVRAGTQTSPDVRVRVSPRVTIRATRAVGAVVLRVAARPARPGAAVVLERYVRERFSWLPYARLRSGPTGTAAVRLRGPLDLRLRAVVLGGGAAWAPGQSGALTVRAAAPLSRR